ncbi:hypothetical protein AUTU_07670 [Aureibacter tunicatorum]|nr:hypothetical protein AUTU_07670 [Aureibacter tunicatorum]
MPPSQQTIQCLMHKELFRHHAKVRGKEDYQRNPFLPHIEHLLDEFEHIRGLSPDELRAKNKIIYEIQHEIYRWNDKFHFFKKSASNPHLPEGYTKATVEYESRGKKREEEFFLPPHAVAMLKLLNDSQNELERLMIHFWEQKILPYVPDMIEEAQASSTSRGHDPNSRQELEELWAKIIEGDKLVVKGAQWYDEEMLEKGVGDFKSRVHTLHAQLMTSSTGRVLLRNIIEHLDHKLYIQSLRSLNYGQNNRMLRKAGEGNDFFAFPFYNYLESIFLPHVWSEAEVSAFDEDWLLAAEEGIDVRELAFSMSMRRSEKKVSEMAKKRAPDGELAEISEHARDKGISQNPEAREVNVYENIDLISSSDQQGGEVLAPSFIRYANMLYAAVDAQRHGLNRSAYSTMPLEQKMTWGPDHWKRIIEECDNGLRIEHNLPRRKYLSIQKNPVWYRSLSMIRSGRKYPPQKNPCVIL